jgi:nitrogen fixation NifU-like protein
MDAGLHELYQDIILEHNRSPHNKGVPVSYDAHSKGYNASCGDRISVYASFDGDVISTLAFSGEGCAISQASASLMTQLLENKTKSEALEIIGNVCGGLSGKEVDLDTYGDVKALAGVKQFPMRIKCATLAWHALEEAINETSCD